MLSEVVQIIVEFIIFKNQITADGLNGFNNFCFCIFL